MKVPAGVPSEVQSSSPWTPSLASNSRVPLILVRLTALGSPFGLIVICLVPAAVPSDTHKEFEYPEVDDSSPLKNNSPLTCTKDQPPAQLGRLVTKEVPVAVPSLL